MSVRKHHNQSQNDKGLISLIYKENFKLWQHPQNIKKFVKIYEQTVHTPPQDIQIALKHIRRYSTSHMIKDMQIKTTVAEAIGKWAHSSLVGIESGNSPFKGEFSNSSIITKIYKFS